MKHLIFLRMEKACFLLGSTSEKIETNAHAVGYDKPFTFSATSKK